MKTVLVFKTSINSELTIKHKVEHLLNNITRNSDSWNFDLEDCDNILRVETQNVAPEEIINPLIKEGFYCEELKD
ncbi:hypothetical protein [Zhouia amylolytica]|uniref:hypothetical protein n=1 Tax=Zhouia amylolytica TaxID=376730 RepID=UPI0020CFB14A|nr:hypothetical protein [Zhouia amylolytica]MCQ0111361.1 hypothetical protein [Zhouia amylolytica]